MSNISTSYRYHASYLTDCFHYNRQSKTIRRIKELLQDVEFDAFIVSGLSGALMGSVVARSMRKQLMVVRKPDNAHSPYKLENYSQNSRCIFLDDLISSGETFLHVRDTLKTVDKERGNSDKPTYIVGSVLYASFEGYYRKGDNIPNFND